MRITDVHIHQPCGLLRLRTDTELEGWCPGVDESSAGHILRSCRDTVVGADPMERERLWNELVRLDRFAYLPHSVWGFLDVALWDLAAKACGVRGDAELARELRAVLGDDFILLHDPVESYTYDEAVRIGRVQEHDYTWIEEPLQDYDLLGLQ